MRHAALALAIGFFAVAGCSGKSMNGGGGAGGTGGGGAGGSGGGGMVPSDGGVTVNGDAVTITMTPFPVPAGGEVYMCQTFANPFGGMDVDIAEFESHMSPGSHHMLLLFQDNATDGALTPCSGLTFGPMPYGAQQPDASITYPAGIGATIKGTQGFNVVAHYLNATQSDLTAVVQVTMHIAPAGSVTQHAGVFFLDAIKQLLQGVPAGVTQTITASYTTTIPMQILYATGHTHRFTTSMNATAGSNQIYQTDSWDNSPTVPFSPAMSLPAGTQISWSCVIDNTTTGTITFGESAQTNEMCIFNGQYYPVPAGADPSINVNK